MAQDEDEKSQGRGQPSAQDTGSEQGQDELAVQFADLARRLEPSEDPDRALEEIVRAAVEIVPGTDEGSISVVLRRRTADPADEQEQAARPGRGGLTPPCPLLRHLTAMHRTDRAGPAVPVGGGGRPAVEVEHRAPGPQPQELLPGQGCRIVL